MAIDNLLARTIAQIGKNAARNRLLSSFAPPSYDDVLHDGLVGSGQTLVGILGTTVGALGGEAIGGPRAAIAGSALLGPVGTLAGGWAAHGAYREGQLVGNILSHPENWTVDAAGAIVPVMPAPSPPSAPKESNDADARYLRRVPQTVDSHAPPRPSGDVASTPQSLQSGIGTVGQNSAPPVRLLSSRQQNPLGDGMTGSRSSVDPADPQYAAQPAPSPQQPGGLLGLLLDHLRNNPNI